MAGTLLDSSHAMSRGNGNKLPRRGKMCLDAEWHVLDVYVLPYDSGCPKLLRLARLRCARYARNSAKMYLKSTGLHGVRKYSAPAQSSASPAAAEVQPSWHDCAGCLPHAMRAFALLQPLMAGKSL